MNEYSRQCILNQQITGSTYDAKGYAFDCGYSQELRQNALDRFDDQRQIAQGRLRQKLIDLIVDKGLEVIGMLTISPYRKLDINGCSRLSNHIRECVVNRYAPRKQDRLMFLPFYEKDADGIGHHLHILFFGLPTDKSLLGKATLINGVKEVVMKRDGRDFIPPAHLSDPHLHKDLYDYAIRNPYDPNGNWADRYRYRSLVPNSAQGMRWSVTGDYQLDKDGKPRNQFDGFHGWHGLLAYCTKTIFSEADLAEHTDAYLYTCLINTPTCPTTSKPNLTDFL